ncbi:unnamed protein product [Ambrosiozyma monospora]|uniref:Unnamed protein product n=1 Tax=Ambrosiozyma monospora TaxID=43982 RepID=A0A9W6Z168_AMBMO|nr:unnamed protein product [Ambrosiozyma monospora]
MGYSQDDNSALVKTAININFLVNLILLIGKLVVAYLTRSMSIIASLVDSVLDLLSTMIIYVANHYASNRSTFFPIGRRRLEPIGVLVFSIVIIVSFTQVLISALETLFDGSHEGAELTSTAIFIMISTIGIKILCFLWCEKINNSSVQALAEDAKTDVVFNFFSLIFPFVGSLLAFWWMDSLGAAVLCMYVIYQWVGVAFEHINNLSGESGSKEDYQEILYLIVRFSDSISKIKNFRIYHVGDLMNVEVDIVIINHELTLKECHDLGESLQYAIETIPFVERCFVHLDYKENNFIGHLNK